jgi:hypothetical protein
MWPFEKRLFLIWIAGKIFLILRPKTRGNEFEKLAIWGTIFVGTERQQVA